MKEKSMFDTAPEFMDVDSVLNLFETVADRWDEKLQREFNVDGNYTDAHAREIRLYIEAIRLAQADPKAFDAGTDTISDQLVGKYQDKIPVRG